MAKSFGGGLDTRKCDINNRTSPSAPAERKPIYVPLEKTIGEYSPEELISFLNERGVEIKRREKAAEKLFVNFSEPDIGVMLYSLLALTYPDKIINGALILMRILSVGNCVFVFPKKYYREANIIYTAISDKKYFSVITVADRYPMNDPHALISTVENVEINGARKIETTKFETVNPEFCLNIFDALAIGLKPVKYYSAGGNRLKRAGLSFVEENENVARALEKQSLAAKGEVICGGLVKGKKLLAEDCIPADTSSLLFMKRSRKETREYDCVACGKCDAVCPMRLTPSLINEMINRGRNPDRFSPMSCIGCGCCSYVCPCGEKIAEKIAAYNGECKKDVR